MENEELSVEQVMADIRAEAESEAPLWQSVRFEDIPVEASAAAESPLAAPGKEALEMSAQQLGQCWRINFYRPLPAGRRIVTFFKRVVRKLIRFCVEPITQECTEYNRTSAACVLSLRAELRRQEREIKELRERLGALENAGK